MKRRCVSCERPLRKGSMRRASVWTKEGIVNGICCTRCALTALSVVIPPPTILAPLCKCCKRSRATTCDDCVTKLERHVNELTRANVELGKEKLT